MTEIRAKLKSSDKTIFSFEESERLLANYDVTDFTTAERLIELFARQPYTVSGFPRVRPGDCTRITVALENILIDNVTLFKMGDPLIIRKFDAVVESFSRTEIRAYTGEFQRLLVLQTRTRLLCNDIAAAMAIIGPLASKPYAIEVDFDGMLNIFILDLQCRSALGKIEETAEQAIRYVKLLVGMRPLEAWNVGWRFANFISLKTASSYRGGFIESIARFWAGALANLRRQRNAQFSPDAFFKPNRPAKRSMARSIISAVAHAYSACLGYNLFLMRFGDIRLGPSPKAGSAIRPAGIVVTRATGGIGDLLMMTPGLRALAKKYGEPVKFVVPSKYFAVFESNPNVELIDMDGPAVDVAMSRRWFNLTICPATAYEAPIRPYAKKGRVELFARGMGIKQRQLNRLGQRVELNLSADEIEFSRQFRLEHALEGRPIIGVQPFSREEYRNYPAMDAVIEQLANKYNVIVFHHRDDGVPQGAHIVSTAGMSLRKSFALGSILDVLVSVDSSFLHVASAFDIPTVALFGPIDGKIRTMHIPRVNVISLNEAFPCAPCWRNEDEFCHVTLHTGQSPCLAAIRPDAVIAAVESSLVENARRSLPS